MPEGRAGGENFELSYRDGGGASASGGDARIPASFVSIQQVATLTDVGKQVAGPQTTNAGVRPRVCRTVSERVRERRYFRHRHLPCLSCSPLSGYSYSTSFVNSESVTLEYRVVESEDFVQLE